MTEGEWLVSDDPEAMLLTLGVPVNGQQRFIASARKLRLFAEAITGLSGSDSHMAYEWILHPNEYSNRVQTFIRQAADCGTSEAVQAALLRDIFGNPFRPPVFPKTAGCHWCAISDASHVHVPDAWLTWHDGIVVKLAQAAYQERAGRKCGTCNGYGRLGDFGPYGYDTGRVKCLDCGGAGTISDGTLDAGRLAVIADALIEAGANEESDLVRHLRGWEVGEACVDPDVNGWDLDWRKSNHPHVRGCWAVDLLLGKS